MTLPSFGPLSLGEIAIEYSKPPNLQALYGVSPGIPVSGPISIGDFYEKESKSILYLGSTTGVRGGTNPIPLPETGQPGDLVVVAGVSTYLDSTPSGYSAVNVNHRYFYYRVCLGGETTAPRSSPGGYGTFSVLMFRPVGGSLSLTKSLTYYPPKPVDCGIATNLSVEVVTIFAQYNFPGTNIDVPSGGVLVRRETGFPPFTVVYRIVNEGGGGGLYTPSGSGTEARITAGVWSI